MQTTAYDLSLFESKNLPQKPRVRVAQGGALRTAQAMKNLRLFAGVTLLLMLVVCYLYSQAVITELTTDLQRTQRQLVAAQSEYDYLSSQMDSKTSLKNVAEIATGQLGLMKVDKSQITYVTLEQESVITLPESGIRRWLDMIGAGLLSAADYLNP